MNQVSYYYANYSSRYYIKATDEEGNISEKYINHFKDEIKGKSAVGTSDEIEWIYEYDLLGNLTKIQPPNHWQDGADNVSYDTDFDYNTLGQMIEKRTPDEGTSKFIYDLNGNLRYKQEAYQASNGDFTVYYYDALNRLTHIGEEIDDADFSLSLNIDNTDYGTEDGEWKIKYFYDDNYVTGSTNYCKDRLSRVEVNNDDDPNYDQLTKYVYDKFGNLLEEQISNNGLIKKIIKHDYDLIGNETELIYPYPSDKTFFGYSMVRPLRINYPNGVYHITNRGVNKQPIFLKKKTIINF